MLIAHIVAVQIEPFMKRTDLELQVPNKLITLRICINSCQKPIAESFCNQVLSLVQLLLYVRTYLPRSVQSTIRTCC